MRIYLSNKMSGIPYFNAPWFDKATADLLSLPHVTEVFNPAEHDRKAGFDPMNCPNGALEEAEAAGFSAPVALGADWLWIAHISDGNVIGPDWRNSPGSISEIACHQALRKPVWEFTVFLNGWSSHRWMEKYKLPSLLELGKLEDQEPDSEEDDGERNSCGCF